MDPRIKTRREFPELFNTLGLLGHGVEVGVAQGDFALWMRSFWSGKCIHLVDRWKHVDGYDDIANVSDGEFDLMFALISQRFVQWEGVCIYRLDSVDASMLFPDQLFDWIYLDADHSYRGLSRDLQVWYPRLRAGGIMAGHDYVQGKMKAGLFEVKQAVGDFRRAFNIESPLYITGEDWPSWYWRKE